MSGIEILQVFKSYSLGGQAEIMKNGDKHMDETFNVAWAIGQYSSGASRIAWTNLHRLAAFNLHDVTIYLHSVNVLLNIASFKKYDNLSERNKVQSIIDNLEEHKKVVLETAKFFEEDRVQSHGAV